MQQNGLVDGPLFGVQCILASLRIFLFLKQHAIIVGSDAIGFFPVICSVSLMSLS
jgi:hypothetical protein